MSYIWVLLPAAIAILIVAAVLIVSWTWNQFHSPFHSVQSSTQLVRIEPGLTSSEISRKLESGGHVKSARLFLLYLWLTGNTDRIQAGEYLFDRPLSIAEISDKMIRGVVHYYKVTVPEGLDLKETAKRFVDSGFASHEEFEDAVKKTELIRDLDPEATDLEGYLFPDTYFLPRGATALQIVRQMVSNHLRIWDPVRRERVQQTQMTIREIVTLASLIEKETGLDSERPLVSAVFHNRLDRGMKLACDPTVIFAVKLVKPYDGTIHQSDLNLDSPYNTYIYPGLPPGPIASPGQKSVEAALNPEDSDYLYFVSKNDGSHFFSRSYDQHSKAVQKFQR